MFGGSSCIDCPESSPKRSSQGGVVELRGRDGWNVVLRGRQRRQAFKAFGLAQGAIENRRLMTIASPKLSGPFDSRAKRFLYPSDTKVLLGCNCKERVNQGLVIFLPGVQPAFQAGSDVSTALRSNSGKFCRRGFREHQPRNAVMHLTVAIWSIAWFPAPRLRRDESFPDFMCLWWLPCASPRCCKRQRFQRSPARNIYLQTRWYQLRRNLPRRAIRAKVICAKSP
jgi:hypothetical protein